LELPHRHEEDNVHDFQRGLRPSIHKEVALKNPMTLHETIQAAMRAEAAETKIETTQRTVGRLNAIEEDNDFSKAAEEFDSESEEDSHGATDDKPRDLYEIRRLTQEEVDRFKEGKCRSLSFATRSDTSLSTPRTQRTRRTTERANPGRESETLVGSLRQAAEGGFVSYNDSGRDQNKRSTKPVTSNEIEASL
jgi:hypothetical protein